MILMEDLVRQFQIRQTLICVVDRERQVPQLLDDVSYADIGVHRGEVFNPLNPGFGVFEPRLIEGRVWEERGLQEALRQIQEKPLLKIPVVHLVIGDERSVGGIEGPGKDLQRRPGKGTRIIKDSEY